MNTSGFYRADDAEIERMTDPIQAANIVIRRESRERLGKFVFSFVEHPLALPAYAILITFCIWLLGDTTDHEALVWTGICIGVGVLRVLISRYRAAKLAAKKARFASFWARYNELCKQAYLAAISDSDAKREEDGKLQKILTPPTTPEATNEI